MFNDIKHFLIAQILFFLRVHGIGDIFAADIDEGSSPVIHEGRPGYDYDTFTLDRIEADFEHGTLAVEASSSDDNGTWDAGDLPVEVVYDLLEWLMEHEDTIIEYAKEAREEPGATGKTVYVVSYENLWGYMDKKYGPDKYGASLENVSDEDFKEASEKFGWNLSVEQFISEFNADGPYAPTTDSHYIRLI